MKTKSINCKNIHDIKYDIKINLDRKKLSKVCKNNSRTAGKDSVTDVFILTSSKSLEMIKINVLTTDKQS